ncbi:hypothetical protein H0E87_021743, partial [Populus deltoides]
MDSTIANVNGRLEKLAADTEPTIVYSSEREVAATHHLGKVLGIHRDTNDGLVAEHIRRQIDMKYIKGMIGLPLSSCSGAQDVIACDVRNPDHIDVEFESIGGLESIKQA